MAHPVVHAEIRSADPDATREFFADLFGWTYSEGAFPGYTFIDTGVEGASALRAISPLQNTRTRCCSSSAYRTSRRPRTGRGARRHDRPAHTERPWRQLRRLRRSSGPSGRCRRELSGTSTSAPGPVPGSTRYACDGPLRPTTNTESAMPPCSQTGVAGSTGTTRLVRPGGTVTRTR